MEDLYKDLTYEEKCVMDAMRIECTCTDDYTKYVDEALYD